MNLLFVVYAFLWGAVMDIGSTIGPTEVRAISYVGETESEPTSDATAGVKSDKKSKNSQQHPEEGTRPPTRELLVQTGRDCVITTHAASGDYRLRATIGNATVVFSERPVQTAGIIATPKFVENFKELFNTSAPNAAITFARDTEQEQYAAANNTGPLIVILSRPSMIGSSIIEYTLTQSNSQGAVASITQFLDMSGVSCSIFIDSVAANSYTSIG